MLRLISRSHHSLACTGFHSATVVRDIHFVALVFINPTSIIPETACSFCVCIEPEPLPLGLPILESTELNEIEGDA